MKKILLLLFFIISGYSEAQLSINNTPPGPPSNLTPTQLVQNVLVGAGVIPNNILFNGSPVNALTYCDQAAQWNTNFTPTNIGFDPNQTGVLLCTGIATTALGPNTLNGSTALTNKPLVAKIGDPDLQLLAGAKPVQHVSIIEFDFVSTGLELNFDFVFGSEEYPEYAPPNNSTYNDVFGFFLSGPGITGPYSNNATNIALLPSTTTGNNVVSINNVNAVTNNKYYVENLANDTQFDGFTTKIRAHSDLQCGGVYHIKLAVGNVQDNGYDSGVFLQNFAIGGIILTDDFNLPENTSVCDGYVNTIKSGVPLQSGIPPTDNVFIWSVDTGSGFQPVGGNTPDLVITTGGNYKLDVFTSYGCKLGSDTILMKYLPPLPIIAPVDINTCNPNQTVFNINQNTLMLGGLDPGDYQFTYYETSHDDAFNGVPTGIIPKGSLATYTIKTPPQQQIWVRVEDLNSPAACYVVKSFFINVYASPTVTVNSPSICSVNSATVTATPSPGAVTDYSYAWTVPSGPSPGNVASFQTSVAGTYSVVITNLATGCLSLSASGTVTVFASPTITGNTTICEGLQSQLAGSNAPATVNSWSSSNTSIATVDNTGLVKALSIGTTTITYNDANGCFATTLITVNPTPAITGTLTICEGFQTQLTGSPTPAAINPWTSSNTAVATVSNTGLIMGISSGTSTITYTNSSNCIATATITVNALPIASISGTASTCYGSTAVITFNGTPNAIVKYTVDAGPNQTIPLNGLGIATITTPALTVNTTYSLVSVANPSTTCSQAQSGSAVITIIALPTASISGTTTICSGNTVAISFNGTPNATVTYTVNSGANQTIPLNGAGTATLTTPALAVNTTYALVSVASSGTPSCSQAQVGSAVITVNPLPTASISGTTAICSGTTAVITFNGTPNAIISYTVDGTPATIPLNAAGTATLTTPVLTTASVYTLVSISNPVTTCSQNQSGSATISINPLPTATISGTTSICSGTATDITFTGTPNAIVTYNINNGGNLTVPLNGSGTAVISTGNITINTTYNLVSALNPTTNCTQPINGSATVTTVFAPVITKPSDYIVCDDNYDGVSCLFDLHSKDGEISAVPVQITYYRTLADSQSDTSPITANPYCNNLSPLAQTIYVRVVDPAAPTCASYTTLQLIVNPIPTIKPVSDYQLCDNNSPGDGIEVFTLSSKDADVLGGQTGMTVSYYLTQADAQTPTNPLPNSYTNVPPSPQTIWYSITTTATTCAAVGSLKLVVNPLPVVTVNSSTVCQGDPATVTATPSTLGSYTYSWTVPSGQNPGNVPSFQTTIAGIYTATITNTVTGCTSLSASGTVTHTLAPVITNPTPYVVCDDNNDGVSCLFDLHSKDVEISTVPGIEITYYRTFADSQTPGPPITANPYCNNNSAFTQTIYVRVVDPAAPTCASYTTLQLIVNPAPNVKIPITDYQLCDVNNPGDGVEVFTLSTKDIEIINGQPSMAVTYYLTQADAQAQSNPLPNSYTNVIPNKQTIWYNIHSTATGCTNTGSLNLVVSPLPSVLPNVSDYQLCDIANPGDGKEVFTLSTKDSEITNGQAGVKVSYYLTQAGAQNQTPALLLPNSYTNISNPQTIWYSINNTTTKCFSVGSFRLVVNPLPLPLPLQPYAVCDTYGPSSTDGLGEFDLSTLTPKIVYQTPGVYTVTYHKTQSDADNNIGVLPLIYHNTTPFVEFIYLRATNPTTGCFSVMQVELNVDSAPVMPTLAPIVNCDTDNNTQDGCTTFNLNLQTPIILAAQSGPAANYTVTYYSSQGAASSTPAGAPIVATNNYVSCGTNTVWVRIDNIVAGCFNEGSFDLQVNTPIALNTPTLLSQCDNDANPNDLHTTFDMCSYLAAYIPAGHTFQFYFDAAHMQPIPCVYKNDINFPANQTVYLEVTNDVTGCKSYRTLTLEVLPIPKPKTDPAPMVSCDINNPNDGYEVFDLTTNAAYILNSDANATLHYFASQQDAMDNVNEILNPTTANVNDNVWIRVESKFSIDSNNEHCYVLVEQPIVVNPLPLITPNVVYQECDDDTDGLTVFDLTSQAAALLSTNAPPLSNYSLAFYEDAFLNSQINPATAYTNTSNPQNIYVVATNLTTGCVSPTGLLVLTVNPKPLATAPPDFASCDYDGTNDGYYLLPLDPLVSDILTGQDPNDFTVTFYDTQADATAGTNPIVDTANYMAYTHTVWVRVEDNATGCFRLVSFNVTIELIPEPTITTQNNSNVICVDFKTGVVVRPLLLEITNPIAGNYTYQWFEATNPTIVLSTDPTYLVDTATLDGSTRNYTVVLTSTTALSCGASSVVFPVLQSGQAVIVGATGYTVSNAFSENQTITVTVDGYGTYAYSLDDGPRQDSNVFQNVGLGSHNITVWDTEGGVANSCDPLEITEVQTIDYPHYFTPNGDGINDTWNIVGLANQPTAKIYIFDRYGKLIKQIAPDGLGWDGTYNGNEMPSTDYWFTVDYNEQDALKQFKAHFAMKR